MNCDKCGKPVEPENNALLYDAAFEASANSKKTTRYTSQTTTLNVQYPRQNRINGVIDPLRTSSLVFSSVPLFNEGEIVIGDPIKSMENVEKRFEAIGEDKGRHLYPVDGCEGSPSRVGIIERGICMNGEPLSQSLKRYAKAALNSLKEYGERTLSTV